MRQILYITLICTLAFASLKDYPRGHWAMYMPDKKSTYTVQLFCIKKRYTKSMFKKIPKAIKKEIYLHYKNNILIACYGQSDRYSKILKKLKIAKKVGFKDAYIRKTKWFLKKDFKQIKKERNENNFAKDEIEIVKKEKKKALSGFEITDIISKINQAYQVRDYYKMIGFYERLLGTSADDTVLESNLCYLYGRFGIWDKAHKLTLKKVDKYSLIYAYANGAVKTMQKNFYKDLKDYIKSDQKGYLLLLSGYYFEKKGDLNKAFYFYKSAYEKDKNDLYNVYAFARFLDIIGEKTEAIKLYKELYANTPINSQMHKEIKILIFRGR